jgi:hypothetical protein
MTKLTEEQEYEILDKAIDAQKAGDEEEASRLARQLPVPPWLAKAVKEIFGVEYLQGRDLSLAEAEYGSDWLNK